MISTQPEPSDLGTCDFCQERIGEHGLMLNTGETIQLEDMSEPAPVVRIYCSATCLRDDQDNQR